MELRQLRAFVALAETLNFSRAAKSLFISQSALSRQIASLEEDLGVQLFTRNSRFVELTAAGENFLKGAKELLDRQLKLSMEVKFSVDTTQGAGQLCVGTDTRALMAPRFRKKATDIICSLRDVFPGIRISVQTDETRNLLSKLREGELDVVFLLDWDTALPAEMDQCCLGQEEMVLAFRAKHIRRPDELRNIIMERGLLLIESDYNALYRILHIMDRLEIKPQINFCKSLNDAILTVLVGESATILPASYVELEDNHSLQIMTFPGELSTMNLNMVWRKKSDNKTVHEIVQSMTKTLEQSL